MEFRRLGRSGIEVSVLCLGAMMFGDRTSEEEARSIVASAREAGVNFIDTADAYAGGESERIVGSAIASDRDRWVLATKVGTRFAPHDKNRGGLSRKWLMRAIEDSLSRLRSDYVDIYFLHLDDPQTPLEETIGALGDLVRSGKIRYWGVSNTRGWKIAEMMRLCGAMGVAPPVAAQPHYNIMNRMAETDYLPACAHYGIGVVPYSPLARGVLTGKYPPDGAVQDRETRAGRGDKRMMETEFRPESLALAKSIADQASAGGRTSIGFALNWVLAHAHIHSVVTGPRTLSQWQSYLSGVAEGHRGEDESLVDGLVRPGHASTHGYSDPIHGVKERPVRSLTCKA
jgi:aryl-alcohol dehydrogenase-like predicted oxidoreductase